MPDWVPTGGDGKQGYNTYYQWGRKDAFIPATWNAGTNRTVYDISNATVTGLTYKASTAATIADNIKNRKERSRSLLLYGQHGHLGLVHLLSGVRLPRPSGR